MMKFLIFLILATSAYGQQTSSVQDTPCTTKGGGEGICINYLLCTDDGAVIDDGAGLLDIRFGEECTRSLEVCCGPEGVVTVPIIPPTTIRPPPAQRTGCGIKNSNGAGVRVTGDKLENTQFGEFPWMVALLRNVMVNGKSEQVYKCGGTLIHWRAVLTAAHCITANEELTARAGEWDTQIRTEPIPHQERKVIRTDIHKDYGKGNMFNDIALLTLESAFNPTNSINLICLPPFGQYVNPGTCYVTGWGKDTFGREGRYRAVMKKIDLPIVTKSECQKSLRKTRLGGKFVLHRSFVCAGGVLGKDPCTGDGGSPLVCPIDGETGRYQLGGLVSWGIGCGETGVPGVYVNVPSFREWIEDQLIYADITDLGQVNRF